jgi:hypothetical protein
MEAMLGISLYSYLYLKLSKMHVFLIFFYVFCSTKITKQEGRTGSSLRWSGGRGEREVAQIMYMHVSKCKNDLKKIKK